jgi:outer membrane protein assembly factor BamE (lipoprotein component of BamABCDE complex)
MASGGASADARCDVARHPAFEARPTDAAMRPATVMRTQMRTETSLSRRSLFKTLAGLAGAASLAGCAQDPIIGLGLTLPTSAGMNEEITRGFVFDADTIAKVKTGMDVQAVLNTLGTPSTTSTVGNKTFYYIGQTVRRRFQFQELSVVDQKVLTIYFNKGFKVERIANYGLQDGVIFDFITRTTPTGGEEQSFLRNLFRGVTSFNPLKSS